MAQLEYLQEINQSGLFLNRIKKDEGVMGRGYFKAGIYLLMVLLFHPV